MIIFLLSKNLVQAQCPTNIDFETGTFAGWTSYTGNVSAGGGTHSFLLSQSGGPVPDRQTMYTNSTSLDPYGGFPIRCPNGSGNSIKLGNDMGGGEGEGISYEFTIPANRNEYSIIYHYAVVFQDPNHLQHQQPRMEAVVTNVTDNATIDCSSFSFFPYGSILPGFFESSVRGDDGTPIWCKNWSAVSINLDGLAGKTISLFFKTGDCTFRRHFGYAYIDVNTECSSEYVGAAYCKDDTAINLTAPYGYQDYTWYNNNFTQTIGRGQSLHLDPPPLAGTLVAVELTPYSGYGCLDTLYLRLVDTLTIRANAGPDVAYCSTPVMIGANPKPGVVYSWSPALGLSGTSISNPLAAPQSTTNYILTTRHDGGGCVDVDNVVVHSAAIDNSMELTGKAAWCIGSGDSTILTVQPAFSIQWYRNNTAIAGATNTSYRVIQSGTYHAVLTDSGGCSVTTSNQPVAIERAAAGVRYPVRYAIVGLPIDLKARTIGDTAVWGPANNLNTAQSFTPVFTGTTNQQYTIRIVSNIGCVTVDTQLVKTIDRADIYVPTAFTPNNDGRNDQLKPLLAGITELRFFRVYNRWGQLLYQTQAEEKGWDGRFNGTMQATQTVVWVAEGLGVDGKVYMRKGSSVLVR